MSVVIRQATEQDATAWIELLSAAMGTDYADKQVYDPAWVEAELRADSGHTTLVAIEDDRMVAALTMLHITLPNQNPIANVGRDLFLPESFASGAAEALLVELNKLCENRREIVVARVFASDNQRMLLYEERGFECVGFQPFKHSMRTREGILFYMRVLRSSEFLRQPLSESLPQVTELASAILPRLGLGAPHAMRDGVTGYPLQTDAQISEATFEEYQARKAELDSMNPPVEVSGGFNLGAGFLRVTVPPILTLLALHGENVVGGIAFVFDDRDRCVRVADAFATDDASLGPLMQHLTKVSQEKHNAIYVEVDVIVTAPRLLKSLEQLGFVPVAYLPGFFRQADGHLDVVKLVKLNLAYSLENAAFTTNARLAADMVDRNFQDQKLGVAILKLLRNLQFFQGLGDGELRKISRLFAQKLFRPAECVFKKGDTGSEAYIIMRGQVDIVLEEGASPVATLGAGKVFGEQAFLDNAPRTAMATAKDPSILLVIQRDAFSQLVNREPHLGMVVMRNIALEMSARLRRAQHK